MAIRGPRNATKSHHAMDLTQEIYWGVEQNKKLLPNKDEGDRTGHEGLGFIMGLADAHRENVRLVVVEMFAFGSW